MQDDLEDKIKIFLSQMFCNFSKIKCQMWPLCSLYCVRHCSLYGARSVLVISLGGEQTDPAGLEYLVSQRAEGVAGAHLENILMIF